MSLGHLQPAIKLSLHNPQAQHDSVFGPGIVALCKGVRDTGSLNAAAKHMGMAYSKAWRILKDTESALGVQLLVREGAHGSTLTDECLQLLDAYDQLKVSLDTFAQQETSRILS